MNTNPEEEREKKSACCDTLPGHHEPERVSARLFFVSGTALATGVCQRSQRQTPVASTIPLTNAEPPE
jgi:hypothetical protein